LTWSLHAPTEKALRRFAFALVALALALTSCGRSEPEGLPSVRLGMSPRDVRDRFEPGGSGKQAGAWQTTLGGSGDDTVLEWTSHEPATTVEHARFEFHLGMLVAVRARLRTDTKAEHIETTPKTVLVHRRISPGETDLTLLARDCPTHHEEAEGLARSAR
jgi:hypothetical protein